MLYFITTNSILSFLFTNIFCGWNSLQKYSELFLSLGNFCGNELLLKYNSDYIFFMEKEIKYMNEKEFCNRFLKYLINIFSFKRTMKENVEN